MKIYTEDAVRQNITSEILKLDAQIQEYRQTQGCWYWIIDGDYYSKLQMRMKKLLAEQSNGR